MSNGRRRGEPTDLPMLVTLSLDPLQKRIQRPPYKGKNNRRWNNGLQNGKWERRVANNTEILLNPSKIIPEIMKHAPGALWAKEKKGIETKLGGVTVGSQEGEGKGGKSLLVALSRPSSQLVR